MNENNKDSIVIYEAKDGRVELRADIEKDTIWATQDQIAELFGTSKQNIGQHLKSIFETKELNIDSVVKNFFTTANDGKQYKVKFYNLDAIIAVGYRVNSKKATQFRIWATGVLREYLKNGYALQEYKINKSPESIDNLQEAISLITSDKYNGNLTLKISKKIDKK